MKLKCPLLTSLEVTHLEFQIARCKTIEKLLNYAIGIALVVLLFALSSCTLTVHPDGSRTYGIDGAQAARAIEIYSAK